MKNRTKVMLLAALALPALVAARAAPKRDFVREELGLSGDAAEKVQAVLESGRKAGKPLHDRLQVALEKLRWQVDEKADAKDIAATLEQIEKAHAALRQQREGVKGELDSLLTPEGRARLLLAQGPMRMEPPPPPPPGVFLGPGAPCEGRFPPPPMAPPIGPEDPE